MYKIFLKSQKFWEVSLIFQFEHPVIYLYAYMILMFDFFSGGKHYYSIQICLLI